MKQIVVRLVVYAVAVFAVFLGGWMGGEWLRNQRYPQRKWAEEIVRAQVGRMTQEQRQIVNLALERDPLLAALAATNGRREAVERLVTSGPDSILAIQRLALQVGLDGELDGPTAAAFTDGACGQVLLLGEIDPKAAKATLARVETLSPPEYRNVAYDSSYLLILPRLTSRNQSTFRANQDVLTPLLAAADQSEWNGLVERFQKASPRVAEIARNSNLGLGYGMVYMLNMDFVQALEQVGIPEKDAIEFVGVNAQTLRQCCPDSRLAAEHVNRLRGERGPDGKTSLFDWACADPAVFWVPSYAEATAQSEKSIAFEKGLAVLRNYAGSDLPSILIKYGQDANSLRAAIDALARFDNFDVSDPGRRSSAAKFLNHFQDDEGFRSALAQHGALLIPAISVRGKDLLAELQKNPRDIGKYVMEDGTAIDGKPWWTWVPGGNIVFLYKRIKGGMTPEWDDWFWAATDVVILAPWPRGPMVVIRAVREAGEGAVEGTARLLARGASRVAEEAEAKVVGRATWGQAVLVLRNASIKLSQGTLTVAKKAGVFAIEHPKLCTVATVSILWTIYPDKAAEIISRIANTGEKFFIAAAKKGGGLAAGLPGETIKGIWDEINRLKAEQPMLATVYYAIGACLTIGVLLSPFVFLRWLFPEVFKLLVGWAALVLQGIGRMLTFGVRAIRGQPRANN